jgi:hypothetical protein
LSDCETGGFPIPIEAFNEDLGAVASLFFAAFYLAFKSQPFSRQGVALFFGKLFYTSGFH